MPAASARRSASACALSPATSTISTGNPPSRRASISACRFEPLPEASTASLKAGIGDRGFGIGKGGPIGVESVANLHDGAAVVFPNPESRIPASPDPESPIPALGDIHPLRTTRRLHRTDRPRGEPERFEAVERHAHLVALHDQHVADAAVEGAQHFV